MIKIIISSDNVFFYHCVDQYFTYNVAYIFLKMNNFFFM